MQTKLIREPKDVGTRELEDWMYRLRCASQELEYADAERRYVKELIEGTIVAMSRWHNELHMRRHNSEGW